MSNGGRFHVLSVSSISARLDHTVAIEVEASEEDCESEVRVSEDPVGSPLGAAKDYRET